MGSHAGAGGSERVLELLLAGLDPAWVDRVVLLQDGPAVARLRALGARVEVLPAPGRAGLPAAAVALRRQLAAATLVHANGVKAAAACASGLAGTGVPVLWHKHDLSWDGALARVVAAGCAEVVGVSQAAIASLRRGRPGGLRRPALSVVANGVPDVGRDAPADRAGLCAELGVPLEAELVALVGRLHPAKGQLELVAAAPALLRARPEARLLLIGGPDPSQPGYGPAVRARAAALGVSDRVLELGHREDAARLIGACDLVAVTSGPDERGMGREGFGLAGVEAFSAGTPVVGYGDGALPEVLGDAAALVAPGDRTALAAAIARLLADPHARATLARRGRERYEQRYRVEVMVRAFARRYAAVRSRPAG